MDTRNVQKTGNMFYLYLPTAWCREHHIGSHSQVSIQHTGEGSLLVSSGAVKKKPKHLALQLEQLDSDSINKLIVACYINPADSFKITLEKDIDFTTLVNQKRLLNVELVEIEGNTISCESSVMIADPDLLLKTMTSKLKNLLLIMMNNYTPELIQRYEEEIDKNRLLIDKAVIHALLYKESKRRAIELHYIALLSKHLEQLTDHLILLERKDREFFGVIAKHVGVLKDMLEKITQQKSPFTHEDALQFAKAVGKIKEERITNIRAYYKTRIKHYLISISEVLLDWAITRKIETL